MTKISVIVNTRNEEKNIKRCLESVKWADEIVVIDMFSQDKPKNPEPEFSLISILFMLNRQEILL